MDVDAPMQKILIFLCVSLVMAIVLTFYSLTHMEYAVEEEATTAYFGFPFMMKETEPFSGGYFGSLVRERGKRYVFQVNNIGSDLESDWINVALNADLKPNWNGMAFNLIFYTLASFFVVFSVEKIQTKWKSLQYKMPSKHIQ
jgi:hypothetical protein